METVALRHVAFEDLGVWEAPLAALGPVRYVEAGGDLGPLADAGLAIVLGGPVGVGDRYDYPYLDDEIALLRERLADDRPTLGVCLGAQLMAAALGARVYPGPAKEIGWGTLDLAPASAGTPLRHLAGQPVLHWHGDTFDLPAGVDALASTGLTPHQAFAAGRSLALQFHCEADGTAIERWLVGHAAELAAAGVEVPALRAASARHAAAAAEAGRALLADYLAAARLN